jgi:peroxiredoxin
MHSILAVSRLVLFGVFGLAGIGKLASQARCRQMLVAFGVKDAFAGSLAVALPIAELAVAVTLLPATSAWFGATAALFLLTLFIIGIAFNLAKGRTPECNCFGQVRSAPIGWPTLVRNGLLAALAALVIYGGNKDSGPSLLYWVNDLTLVQRVASLLGLGGLVLLGAEAVLLLQLLRQQGRVLLRLESLESYTTVGKPTVGTGAARMSSGLPVGSPAPHFQLEGLDGQASSLESLIAPGKSLLLVFTNPHCGPCVTLAPEIARWGREYEKRMRIAVVSEGTIEDNRSKGWIDGGVSVLLQQKRETADIYQAWGTPAAVIVRPDGAIGSGVAQGAEAIRTLVAQIGESPAMPAAGSANTHKPASVKIGDSAPMLELRNLDGKRVRLADFRETAILVLFWNPACGYCQQMLSSLREWEANPPAGSPALVIVSTGTIEANRALKLRSPVLLDDGSQAATAFGAHGTPMAVLVDSDGRISSEVAAGAQAILMLVKSSIVQQTAKASGGLAYS